MKALQSRKSNVTGHKLHPNSRRAKQLQRVELRTRKLDLQGKVQRTGEIKRGELGAGFSPSQASPCAALTFGFDAQSTGTCISCMLSRRMSTTFPCPSCINFWKTTSTATTTRCWSSRPTGRRGVGGKPRARPSGKLSSSSRKLRIWESTGVALVRSGRTCFCDSRRWLTLGATELPDLTLPENVFLCRQWIKPIGSEKNPRGSKGGDPSFLGR